MTSKHMRRAKSISESDSTIRHTRSRPTRPVSGFHAILLEFLPAPVVDKFFSILPSNFGVLSKKWGTHLIFLLSIIIYDVAGALLYSVIEGGLESEQVDEILAKRKKVMDKIHELVQIGSPTLREQSEAIIKVYEKQLMEYYEKNSKLLARGDDELNWSFWGSAFFCGTVFSLIGSAHIKPLTLPGRALTIFYALIGIPLFLTLLADFGKMLNRMIKLTWIYLENIYNTGSFMPPKGLTDDDDDDDEEEEDDDLDYDNIDKIMHIRKTPDDFSLPVSLALSVFLMYMFFGAVLYYLWEPWTFFESFYFVFISMATIGLGDFIPSTYFHMMSLIVYLIFGLAITSMCINVVQEKISETFSHASAKLGEKVGIEFAEEVEKDETANRFGSVIPPPGVGRGVVPVPGRGGLQMPGRGGMQMPGRGGMQMPGRGGMQMPGRGGMQMPGRGSISGPSSGRGFTPMPGSSGYNPGGPRPY